MCPKAIINTHSHSDHCGGNRYIQEKTGATVYASEIEAGIIQYPYLEPLYLFSGASPIEELKNKFLMAPPSRVDIVIKEYGEKIELGSIELGIVPLAGHSANQIGIEVDDILFCADSVFSKEVLKRHRVPFYIDIDKQRETLMFLRKTSHKFYVPSHAEPCKNITKLVKANLDITDNVERYLLESFHGRRTKEQILKSLCDNYKIELKGIQKYYLMNTITMAYLSSMHKHKKLKPVVVDNSLFWERV